MQPQTEKLREEQRNTSLVSQFYMIGLGKLKFQNSFVIFTAANQATSKKNGKRTNFQSSFT